MEIIKFIDDHKRERSKINIINLSNSDWIDIQNKLNARICPKCGIIYYNPQKFSYHLKKHGLTYQYWKLKYKYNGIIPKCKICGKDCAWLPEHKDYGSTCNSYECFCKNSSITASNTVKIYGDQRNPQCWTYDQILANGYKNRSDEEYIKLLDNHHIKLCEIASNKVRSECSGGMWGWHSKAENKLMNALKLIYPDLIREYYPPKCNGRFRMDAWIPSINTYVEEDGEFKRDNKNPLHKSWMLDYIKEKRDTVIKFTGSKVKNIWESEVDYYINNLDKLKEFIESN